MTKEEYTNELMNLNKMSYDRGFRDGIETAIESFENLKTLGFPVLKTDQVIQMLKNGIEVAEKIKNKTERGAGDDYPIIPQ